MYDYGDFLAAMIESSGSDLSGDFTVAEMEKYLIDKEGYSKEELRELYSQYDDIEDDEPKKQSESETNTGDKDEKRVKNDDYSDDKYDDIKKAINSFIESTGSAPTVEEYNKIIADLRGPEEDRQSKASPASDRDDYSVSEVDVNDDGSVFDDSYDVYDDVTSTGHVSDKSDNEDDDWTDVKNTLKDLR